MQSRDVCLLEESINASLDAYGELKRILPNPDYTIKMWLEDARNMKDENLQPISDLIYIYVINSLRIVNDLK